MNRSRFVSRGFLALVVIAAMGSVVPAASATSWEPILIDYDPSPVQGPKPNPAPPGVWQPILINYDPSPVQGPSVPVQGPVWQLVPCAPNCPLGVMPPNSASLLTIGAPHVYAVITGIDECEEGPCLVVSHAAYTGDGAKYSSNTMTLRVPFTPVTYDERRDLIAKALRQFYLGAGYVGEVETSFPADDGALSILLQ